MGFSHVPLRPHVIVAGGKYHVRQPPLVTAAVGQSRGLQRLRVIDMVAATVESSQGLEICTVVKVF